MQVKLASKPAIQYGHNLAAEDSDNHVLHVILCKPAIHVLLMFLLH